MPHDELTPHFAVAQYVLEGFFPHYRRVRGLHCLCGMRKDWAAGQSIDLFGGEFPQASPNAGCWTLPHPNMGSVGDNMKVQIHLLHFGLPLFYWHRWRTTALGLHIQALVGKGAFAATRRGRFAHDGSNFHDGLVVDAGCRRVDPLPRKSFN